MRNIIVPFGIAFVLAACSPQEAPEPEQRAASEEPRSSAPARAEEQAADGVATGEEEPLTEVPAFAELDKNGDGFLSAAETREIPRLREIFALADGDLDGQLSVAEFSQATLEGFRVSPDAARGPQFTALDEDRNGLISSAEAQAVPQLAERFEELDADGSGNLEPDEYSGALDEGLVDREQIGQNRE